MQDGSDLDIFMDQKLGQGGSGVVYKALMTRRSGATEEVAAKMLFSGATQREHQKFAKEYEILRQASQQCAGVCRVYGIVQHGGALCIVMKLYPQSLLDLLDRRVDPVDASKRLPLPLEDALVLSLPIARALARLHAVDIRMQDLKPANLLLDEDCVPFVSDFGIARLEATTITSTGTGTGNGTPNFMAPELFSGEGITSMVDVWAFAAIFVQMITGRLPWSGLPYQQIITNVLVLKKTPPIPGGLPHALNDLLARCFAFDPTQRPTAVQLVDTLQPIVDNESSDQRLLLMHANSHLQGTWIKRELYTFSRMTSVVPALENPALLRRYEDYKARVAVENGGDSDEHLLFHGCSEQAMHAIQHVGFLKKFWTTAAGDWQRFGPGFYFALQSSKSHEYPLDEMNALPPGPHSRSMLLCKVVKGKMCRTEHNIDNLQGAAPAGYHSVYGVATPTGSLNYDEVVVFDEAAILPFAVVTYTFMKHAGVENAAESSDIDRASTEGEEEKEARRQAEAAARKAEQERRHQAEAKKQAAEEKERRKAEANEQRRRQAEAAARKAKPRSRCSCCGSKPESGRAYADREGGALCDEERRAILEQRLRKVAAILDD